jgi:hypothetical protein
MMLFKKQNDLVNKLNHIEYVFNDKLDDIKSKINETLDSKLNNIETKLIETLNTKINETCNCNIYIDELNNTLSKIINTHEQLNEKINNIGNIQKEQTIKIEENVKIIVDNTKKELLENWRTTDLSLRTDLQTFLLGLQKDIVHNICSQTNLAIEQTKELKSSILLVNEQVNKFYYDNELIKHQLLLEQDIRNYNDEIESIKLTANNLKNTIDDILKGYDFEN